jgi:APA family basic amino acid/polyamine antiporter
MPGTSDLIDIPRHIPGARVVRRGRRRTIRLPRVLGPLALFSTAYGDVGSSIYYALGVTAFFALGFTPLVFLGAGIVFLFTALTYAEGTTMFPESGGASSFARHAFNPFAGFFAGWAQILNYIITISISAFSVPAYLSVFLPILKTAPYQALAGAGLVFVLVIVNIIGVRETTMMNVLLAAFDLTTQVTIVVLGVFLVFNWHTLLHYNLRLEALPTVSEVVRGLSIAMIAYTGIETVSNMAEETRNPHRSAPRAILSVFAVVIILYTTIPLVALSAMPVSTITPEGPMTALGSDYKTDPMIGIVSAFPAGILRDVVLVWIGLLAATILSIASNAGLIGISRLTYSLGHHQQLPPRLAKIHPRFHTPYIAIAIFGAVAILAILPGRIEQLAALYAFSAMMSFTIAHLSILKLRLSRPDLPRPFRIKLSVPWRGVRLPLTAIVGGLCTAGAWTVIMATDISHELMGIVWVALGLIVYAVYRWRLRVAPVGPQPS